MYIIWCPSPKHIILSQAGQSWTFSFANFKPSGFPFWNIVEEFLFKYQQINLISEDRLMEGLDLFLFLSSDLIGGQFLCHPVFIGIIFWYRNGDCSETTIVFEMVISLNSLQAMDLSGYFFPLVSNYWCRGE